MPYDCSNAEAAQESRQPSKDPLNLEAIESTGEMKASQEWSQELPSMDAWIQLSTSTPATTCKFAGMPLPDLRYFERESNRIRQIYSPCYGVALGD